MARTAARLRIGDAVALRAEAGDVDVARLSASRWAPIRVGLVGATLEARTR